MVRFSILLWPVLVSLVYSQATPTCTNHMPITSEMTIRSDITSRYATTLVASRVINPNTAAPQEVNYQLNLPEDAFISDFTIELDNQNYTAIVKEKDAAWKQYVEAVKAGKDAAHLKARDENNFDVNINVGPGKEVIFRVTYEELLARKQGLYQNVISINPGPHQTVVDKLTVDVYIEETRDVVTIIVPDINTNNTIGKTFIPTRGRTCSGGQMCTSVKTCAGVDHNKLKNSEFCGFDITTYTAKVCCGPHIATHGPSLTVDGFGTKSVHISYKPTKKEQRKLSKAGVSGKFSVIYDVDRTPHQQELQVVDGYFVHFFAPKVSSYLNKHVVFVLDTSGSMRNGKLEQVKTAMNSILPELKKEDKFNIITYSTSINVWHKNEAAPVNNQTMKEVKNFINNLQPSGWTNINDPLLKAITLSTSERSLVPLVIFLTDGHANRGESNRDKIIENVKFANIKHVHIFSLAFGRGADYKFMKKLSLKNGGFARRIYEGSDAALQLENFFGEISVPLLSNVKISHLNETLVDKNSISKLQVDNLFVGGEIVIAGRLKDRCVKAKDVQVKVLANSPNGRGTFKGVSTGFSTNSSKDSLVHSSKCSFVSRLWAYKTIKGIMDDIVATDTNDEKTRQALKERGLRLSLEYNFVTELTSRVVVPADAYNRVAGQPTNMASGTSFGNVARVISGCYEDNVIFSGIQVKKLIEIDTVDNCHKECQKNAACSFWSFDTFTNDCYLRSSKTGSTILNDTISGPRDCPVITTPPPPPPPTPAPTTPFVHTSKRPTTPSAPITTQPPITTLPPTTTTTTPAPTTTQRPHIDECKTNTHDCHKNATCTNIPAGLFTCTCNTGYSGDGKSCQALELGDYCSSQGMDCHTPNTWCNCNRCMCKPNSTQSGLHCQRH